MSDAMTTAKGRKGLVALSAVALIAMTAMIAACSSSHDDGGSSGSHWLTCEVDGDCTRVVARSSCASNGICVTDEGERIPVPSDPGGPDAGHAGQGGTNGGGTSGGGGGTSGGGAGGSDSGVAGSDGSVASDGGVVLPECGSQAVGDGCAYADSDPVPECCDAWRHLRCRPTGCNPSIPGDCVGTYERVPGSDACGEYQPCAGKQCGDSCDLCDPTDPSCALGDALFTCDANGACVVGMVSCAEPEMCDPMSENTCGAGRACCAVGRCGPIETGDGICEPADPDTGGCMRCACENQPGGCPICNSPDTPIATPTGEVAIAELREGDLVLSMHHGELVAVPVIAIGHAWVTNHAVVRLVLDDGRAIEVSGSHPTALGARLDALEPGDALGERRVMSVELVPYEHDRTYDILPGSDSGTYLAAGALLGSTLAPPRLGEGAR